MGMMTFDEAQAIIAALLPIANTHRVKLAQAAGHILAQDICARSDMPIAPQSAMDGYAVTASTTAGESLKVIGTSAAGAAYAGPIAAGEAVRIFTGALVPKGADLVIMQEYAERDGDMVCFKPGFGPERHIRPAASDFAKGDILLRAGSRLTPRAMVALAAGDLAEVEVYQSLRTAIISTGDELAAPGEAHLSPEKIPESVSFGVAAFAEAMGAKNVYNARGHDDLGQLQSLAASATAHADLTIITGGASVGERDFAKAMFAHLEPEFLFNKLAIKPGKPVWLARLKGGKYVLGLPGNPTSAMVTMRLLGAPLLSRLGGGAEALTWQELPLSAPLPATGGRETFARACWQNGGIAPLDNQQSGAQAALHHADYLIRCPANSPAKLVGDRAPVIVF